MKRVGKPVFFVILVLVLALSVLSFVGIHTQYGDIKTTRIKGARDILWGLDIGGGVEATFTVAEDATAEDMVQARNVLEKRLLLSKLSDYEIYTDAAAGTVIVRFPWNDTLDYTLEGMLGYLGTPAVLTFKEGIEIDPMTGQLMSDAEGTVILTGDSVKNAEVKTYYNENTGQYDPIIEISMDKAGTAEFEAITERLLGQQISVWMDETLVAAPSVGEVIKDGRTGIGGFQSFAEAQQVANSINSGALPVTLNVESYYTITPALGQNAKMALVIFGVAAALFLALLLLVRYRAAGLAAIVALLGQGALTLAGMTGFFADIPGLTINFPAVAGALFAIGLGIYANVLLAERMKDELQDGKSIGGAITAGLSKTTKTVLAANGLILLLLLLVMGAFDVSGNFLNTLLKPFFFFTSGRHNAFYSFAYAGMIGILANIVMNTVANRFMLRSLAEQRKLRKAWYFGGERE